MYQTKSNQWLWLSPSLYHSSLSSGQFSSQPTLKELILGCNHTTLMPWMKRRLLFIYMDALVLSYQPQVEMRIDRKPHPIQSILARLKYLTFYKNNHITLQSHELIASPKKCSLLHQLDCTWNTVISRRSLYTNTQQAVIRNTIICHVPDVLFHQCGLQWVSDLSDTWFRQTNGFSFKHSTSFRIIYLYIWVSSFKLKLQNLSQWSFSSILQIKT